MKRTRMVGSGWGRPVALLLCVALCIGCFSVALADGGAEGTGELSPLPATDTTPTPSVTPTATPTVTPGVMPTATPTATPPVVHVVIQTPTPEEGEAPEDGEQEPGPTAVPDAGGDRIALSRWLNNQQENGEVPAFKGERDESVNIILPLVARYDLQDVEIEPVYSTSLDSFPFDMPSMSLLIKKVEATGNGDLKKGECWQVEGYRNLVLSHSVTKGIKQVDFKVRYTYGGVRTEETISVYVNVTKGASTGGGGGGVTFHSQPKLIVEKYALSTDKLYAGEPFDLTLYLRNTSSDEAIRNIQLRMVDETGTVLPAENGSNTLYIKEMEKEGAATVQVTLQAAPDAEAKAYAMALAFSYDGVSSKQAYTTEESITLPIQQRIRIKCDEPLVYDEPWVGQTSAVGVSLYNMGKSSIYNCMVTVEGEGLSMPETYFGGNIASGGTMRAEFDVLTDVAGDIAGEVVISYEDVYGEQLQERLPLQMFVNEQIAIDPMVSDEAMAGGLEDSYVDPAMGYADDGMSGGMGGAGGQQGIAWYWWVLAILAVSAGVVVLGIRRRRQRKKELEAL